jgi:hypothetical protein
VHGTGRELDAADVQSIAAVFYRVAQIFFFLKEIDIGIFPMV